MDGSPERFDPDSMEGLIAAEHVGRYRFAASLAEDAEVLDAGCGLGYGTASLAAAGARRAVGVDLSSGALGRAREAAPGVEFVEGDLLDLPFEDASFDLAVCFEAIEHVSDPAAVMAELRRVLRDDGVAVISSPNPHNYPPGNPYHVRELSAAELREGLARHFANVEIYYQHVWIATAVLREPTLRGPAGDLDAALAHVGTRNDQRDSFAIAVASDRELPAPREAVYLAAPVQQRRLLEFPALMRAAEHARNMARSRSWRWTRPFRAAGEAWSRRRPERD